MVAATFGVAAAILTEAGLSFLGLGVQPPTPSWGNMINLAQSATILQKMPWLWVRAGDPDRARGAEHQLHRRRPARRARPPRRSPVTGHGRKFRAMAAGNRIRRPRAIDDRVRTAAR